MKCILNKNKVLSEGNTMVKDKEIDKSRKPSRQVKYANEVNNQDLFRAIDLFSDVENNLFYIIIAQVVNERDSTIKISAEAIKDLLNYKRVMSKKAFIDIIANAFTKFVKIVVKMQATDENGKKVTIIEPLFNKVQISNDTFDCKIQINSKYIPLFNNFKQWTRFSVVQYTNLHSMYSKRLFRILKQNRTLGKKKFQYDEFRKELNIPDSYRSSNINMRVLKPAWEELAPYFKDLRIEKEFVSKNGRGKGKILNSYIFTWQAEEKEQKDFQSGLLEDLTGFYNIKENAYLEPDMKFEALDRFRGRRKGTTKKMYQGAHPQTYFVMPATKTKTKSTYIHDHLSVAKTYSITQLKGLIKLYEILNKQGKLMVDDKKDLVELESILLEKQQKLRDEKKHTDQPYQPLADTIASNVLLDFTGVGIDQKQARKQIEAKVDDDWASSVRGQDRRLPEIKQDLS